MTRPLVYLFVAVLFSGLVTVTAYHKENGLADIFDLASAIDELDQKVADIEQENRNLQIERIALTRSDLHIEGIAREDLGLVRPGEVVYEFVDIKILAQPDSPQVYMQPEKKSE